MDENVKKLIEKAAKVDDAGEAMKFAQAAANAANAICALAFEKRQAEEVKNNAT